MVNNGVRVKLRTAALGLRRRTLKPLGSRGQEEISSTSLPSLLVPPEAPQREEERLQVRWYRGTTHVAGLDDAFEWILAFLINLHAIWVAVLWKQSHFRARLWA